VPEVAELRAKPLAANTDSPLRFRARADDLAVILHDHVKGLATPSKASAETIAELDHHFYQFDYPDTFGRAKTDTLIEPLGAWLGQVLVGQCGGEWVPRAKLEENQVVIGKTAYLPFLRAKHLLASKEAVLDHSLTQFVAHAKLAGR
jgi:hypothetical protein